MCAWEGIVRLTSFVSLDFSNSNYTTSNITEPNRNTDIQLNNQINAAINASEYINDVEMENGHISNGRFNELWVVWVRFFGESIQKNKLCFYSGNGHKNGVTDAKTHLIDFDEDMGE